MCQGPESLQLFGSRCRIFFHKFFGFPYVAIAGRGHGDAAAAACAPSSIEDGTDIDFSSEPEVHFRPMGYCCGSRSPVDDDMAEQQVSALSWNSLHSGSDLASIDLSWLLSTK